MFYKTSDKIYNEIYLMDELVLHPTTSFAMHPLYTFSIESSFC